MRLEVIARLAVVAGALYGGALACNCDEYRLAVSLTLRSINRTSLQALPHLEAGEPAGSAHAERIHHVRDPHEALAALEEEKATCRRLRRLGRQAGVQARLEEQLPLGRFR